LNAQKTFGGGTLPQTQIGSSNCLGLLSLREVLLRRAEKNRQLCGQRKGERRYRRGLDMGGDWKKEEGMEVGLGDGGECDSPKNLSQIDASVRK
jgi:hypothetical protein